MLELDVLAVDAGQSGVRTLEVTCDARTHGRSFPGLRSDRPVTPQLAAIIRQALEGRRVRAVGIGTTALSPTERADDVLVHLRDLVSEVHLAHDSITSYLGALGERTGAVVAAGTGAVTLAVGPSRVSRVDGWGYLLGDEGSGFWIGRQALTAAMWAHDGRGPATLLLDELQAEFEDVSRAYLELQADPNRVARIAAWARTVAFLAQEDPVAARISSSAGQMLAHSVATGLRVVGAEPVVARLGNVFGNAIVARRFAEELQEVVGEVEIVESLGTGLDGAALLPEVDPGSSLAVHIDRRRSVIDS